MSSVNEKVHLHTNENLLEIFPYQRIKLQFIVKQIISSYGNTAPSGVVDYSLFLFIEKVTMDPVLMWLFL